jgi:hypothetical protein
MLPPVQVAQQISQGTPEQLGRDGIFILFYIAIVLVLGIVALAQQPDTIRKT